MHVTWEFVGYSKHKDNKILDYDSVANDSKSLMTDWKITQIPTSVPHEHSIQIENVTDAHKGIYTY